VLSSRYLAGLFSCMLIAAILIFAGSPAHRTMPTRPTAVLAPENAQLAPPSADSAATKTSRSVAAMSLSITFEPNVGQADASVLTITATSGTANELCL
jgi:hypothetical protein